MAEKITIKRKSERRGDDGHKIVSVRMRDELIARLDTLAETANRSRNEIINLLLESAVDIVEIEGEE
ncbi:ribbon-helix-helix protein, CopG family [Pseudoflavonifractor sp. 524-17]|uniref:ribbon-helix-helix protein, CopG family n=1 Tax=Pseudoflavonifractor sp. 524-17 TaxID=2304577 RepID=UPI00137AE1AF|nr:ribbon-helix-helix protein, CopG family [Pseudoflavonifractor sp. 524-17]NCE66434.1 ribbon-helix-helix protein, CopG family [Pseudoflavonifractor sp. 524-17]